MLVISEHSHDSKVTELDDAVMGQENVCSLDVAMDNLLAVQEGEGFEDGAADLCNCRLIKSDLEALQDLIDRSGLAVLSQDPDLWALEGDAYIGEDVGVSTHSQHLILIPELVFSCCGTWTHDFHSHKEGGVSLEMGLVHDTKRALAELLLKDKVLWRPNHLPIDNASTSPSSCLKGSSNC